jgi:GT2 family glycosyltransferase
VVVATHDRARLLPRLVDALAAQDLEAPFDVVVVDDASSDDTPAVLDRLVAAHRWLRAVRQPRNQGPATARNVGWRATSAPLVAFTDDDCVPCPSWLRHLVSGAARADLVQGRTLPDPDQVTSHGPFGHTITVTAAGQFLTCNIAYRREILEAVGGFDERFRLPYGEDTDLGLRAVEHGARIAFAAKALVHHDVMASDFRRYLGIRARRDGFVLACRRHPELRRELRLGVFTHPNAVVLAAAILAAAARPGDPRRAALAAALLVRYADTTMRSVPAPPSRIDWLSVVPLKFVADLYEVGITLRASARYRTVVI